MININFFLLITTLLLPLSVAVAEDKSTAGGRAIEPVARINRPHPPGFRRVGNMWVQPQKRLSMGDLVRVVDIDGRLGVIAKPDAAIEPLLRNGRTALVELIGSEFAWKLSAVGRQWNATRTGPTQHLQLSAVPEDVLIGPTPVLTEIDIKPGTTVVRAVAAATDRIRLIELTLTDAEVRLFVRSRSAVAKPKAAAGAKVAPPEEGDSYTVADLRALHRRFPEVSRENIFPILAELNGGENPLLPRAVTVYTAFSEIPADPVVAARVRDLLPRLADPNPATRRTASVDLAALGRAGVLAVMRLDQRKLPLESRSRLGDFLRANSDPDFPTDPAATPPVQPMIPAEVQPEADEPEMQFLIDATYDADPAVVEAAKNRLKRVQVGRAEVGGSAMP